VKQKYIKIVSVSSALDFSVMYQKNKFREKSNSEFCGGFIKRSDVIKIEGISVPNPSTKECTNYSKTASNNCYFIGTKVQFWTALFLGGLFGLIISAIIITLVFRIKQQHIILFTKKRGK
jgi:hypothetical protein